jgi:hypothetical protein
VTTFGQLSTLRAVRMALIGKRGIPPLFGRQRGPPPLDPDGWATFGPLLPPRYGRRWPEKRARFLARCSSAGGLRWTRGLGWPMGGCLSENCTASPSTAFVLNHGPVGPVTVWADVLWKLLGNPLLSVDGPPPLKPGGVMFVGLFCLVVYC